MSQIQTLLAHSPVVAVPMAGVASTAGPPVARTLGVHLVARHPSSLPNHSRAQKLSFFQASLRSSCGRHPAWATGWCPLGCSSAHSAAQSSKRTTHSTAAEHSSSAQQQRTAAAHNAQPQSLPRRAALSHAPTCRRIGVVSGGTWTLATQQPPCSENRSPYRFTW